MSDNTQTIYIVERPPESTSDEEHFEKLFPSKAVTILAVLQIVAGSLAFISEIVLLATHSNGWEFTTNRIGTGIWCGIIFMISGLVGLFASFKPTTRRFIAFMVTSIISAVFCLLLLIIAIVGTKVSLYFGENVLASFYIIESMLALIMAIGAIVSSALSCSAVCCRRTYLGWPIIRVQEVVSGGDQNPLAGGRKVERHQISRL